MAFVKSVLCALLAAMVIVRSAFAATDPLPPPSYDVFLVALSQDSCGCEASAPTTIDARIKYCGVAQACLEIDVQELHANDGVCHVPDSNCPIAQKACKFTIEVKVVVHSTCCCPGGSNGANVHWNAPPGQSSNNFVGVGASNAETYTIDTLLACNADGEGPEVYHVHVSGHKLHGDIDEHGEYLNADVAMQWSLECGKCKKLQ